MGEECHKGPTPPFPLLSPAEVKSQEPSQDFLDQFAQGNLPNNGDRKHRDANAVMPFVGLTNSKFVQLVAVCTDAGSQPARASARFVTRAPLSWPTFFLLLC